MPSLRNIPALTSALLLLPVTSQAATVAWFYALDQDRQAFEKATSAPLRTQKIGAVVMADYRVGNTRVVAAKMGSGCAQTAVTVSSVLAVVPASCLISTSPAGEISGNSPVGSWRQVSEVVAWQVGSLDTSGRVVPAKDSRVPFGPKPGFWPPGPWLESPVVSLASGEAFIASASGRQLVASASGSTLVDMNSWGIAKALEQRDLPALHLRVISDHADDHASTAFRSFSTSYDGQGGTWVAQLVKSLPPDAADPLNQPHLKKLLEGLPVENSK